MPANKKLFVKRPALVVADLDRSLTLYRDALGFKLMFVKNSDGASYSYTAFGFDPSSVLRFAVFATEEQENCLALLEVKAGPLPAVTAPASHAIVINCDDLDATLKRVAALGLTILPEGELLTQAGDRGREVAVRDWDGHLVVLYRFNNA